MNVKFDPMSAKASKIADVSEEFDEIIYHITHDVRAAIRAIRTLPTWLREDLTSEGVVLSQGVGETLEMLERQANRADQMLLDLRSYSRVGRTFDDPTKFSLQSVVEKAMEDIELPEEFSVSVDQDVPTISGSFNELGLLFQALISNAVKHHDRSRGNVRIGATETDGIVHCIIEDDGPGIPAEFRERVFEMMATLKSRDDCEGSGLGLSIARKIALRHGGRIKIRDTGNERGTCVVVDLPAENAVPQIQ